MCAPKSPQSNNFMRHSAVQRWLSYVYSHLIVRCARICKVCIDAMEVYGISPISVVMCILKLCAYKHFCDKLFNTHPTQWYALPSYPCYPQLYVHFSLPRDSGNGWVFTIIKTHVYIVVRLLYICDLSAAFWGIASFVYCYSIFLSYTRIWWLLHLHIPLCMLPVDVSSAHTVISPVWVLMWVLSHWAVWHVIIITYFIIC